MLPKDYIITITIDEYELPLEKLTFTYWLALYNYEDDPKEAKISDLVRMAVEDTQVILQKLDKEIDITYDMIEIEEVT
jgi:hypothetical protein